MKTNQPLPNNAYILPTNQRLSENLSNLVSNFDITSRNVAPILKGLFDRAKSNEDNLEFVSNAETLIKNLFEISPLDTLDTAIEIVHKVSKSSYIRDAFIHQFIPFSTTLFDKAMKMEDKNEQTAAQSTAIDALICVIRHSGNCSKEEFECVNVLLRYAEETQNTSPQLCLMATGIALENIYDPQQSQIVAELLADRIEVFYDEAPGIARIHLQNAVTKTAPDSPHHKKAITLWKHDIRIMSSYMLEEAIALAHNTYVQTHNESLKNAAFKEGHNLLKMRHTRKAAQLSPV